MNFYRCFSLFFLLGMLATGAVIWGADNYYTVYEPFFSKMLEMSFETGTPGTPQRLDEYSPLCFIGWDKLLIALYNWRSSVSWYDYWTIALHIASLGLFTFSYTAAIWAANQGKTAYNVMLYAVLWILVFYWPLRQLNHTHTAHLLSGVSLAAFYFAQPGFLPHLPGRNIWRAIALVGFVAATCIRWEVATIQLLLYAVLVFTNARKTGIVKSLAVPVIVYSAIFLYVTVSISTDPRFFRQIEPDGEYEVLYHRSVKLNQATNALDSLRIEMLNAWIVDDTNLITIQFFKQAISKGRQSSAESWKLRLKEAIIKASECAYNRWYYVAVLLLLFAGLLLSKEKRVVWTMPLAMVILLPLAYQEVLTERHLYPFLSQLLAWQVLVVMSGTYGRTRWTLLLLLLMGSALHITQVQREVAAARHTFEDDKKRIATLEHYQKQQYTIATEATYSRFFYSKPFVENPVLPGLLHLSFQQFSHTLLHQQYLHHQLHCPALNYGSIYSRLYAKRASTLLIASPHRLSVIQKMLNGYYQLPIGFKEENNLGAKENDAAAPRLYRLVPSVTTTNLH